MEDAAASTALVPHDSEVFRRGQRSRGRVLIGADVSRGAARTWLVVPVGRGVREDDDVTPLAVPVAPSRARIRPSSRLFAICTPVEFGKRYSIDDAYVPEPGVLMKSLRTIPPP